MTRDERIRQVRRRGWALWPGYLDPDLRDALLGDARALARQPGACPTCQYFFDRFADGATRLARIEAVTDALPRLETSGLLARMAADAALVLNAPVVPFKDKLNIRHARSAGYAPHQDAARWAAFAPAFLSFGLFLEPSGPRRGGFRFAEWDPGAGLVPSASGDFDAARFDGLAQEDVTAAAGDALVIDGRAPHCTTSNAGAEPVLHLLLTFAASDDPGLRHAYYAAQSAQFERVREDNRFTFAAR